MTPSDPDEPWIAIAMLHGLEAMQHENQLWYVEGKNWHDIERINASRGSTHGFKSVGAIARAYCEHYGIAP